MAGGADLRALAGLGVTTVQGGRFRNAPRRDGSLRRVPRLSRRWGAPGHPAVVCTHRVNWTSRVDPGNREFSLRCLDGLLAIVARDWPDATFLTSDQLGELMLA